MRHGSLRIVILCSLAAASGAFAGITPEQLAVPTANLSSSPTALKGFLFKPVGDGSHPAVIMMHGCGGAYALIANFSAKGGSVTLPLSPEVL